MRARKTPFAETTEKLESLRKVRQMAEFFEFARALATNLNACICIFCVFAETRRSADEPAGCRASTKSVRRRSAKARGLCGQLAAWSRSRRLKCHLKMRQERASPDSLKQPHARVLMSGGGERKCLKLIAAVARFLTAARYQSGARRFTQLTRVAHAH